MKKKYLSGLVILITVILVTYMIVNNKDENIDYTLVENNQSENINAVAIQEFLAKLEENENKNIETPKDEKENDNTNKKIASEESFEDKNKEKIDETNKIEKKEADEKKENDEEIESYNIEKKESIAVFKVDKNLIMENLSFKEKKDLTKIITSLSMSDYALIMESVKNDGELECVTKINNILEERLKKEEYKLVREILEPYINLEIL
ncbi:MAG: hypothetical protein ACRCWM_12575 [Sarcina sp.]